MNDEDRIRVKIEISDCFFMRFGINRGEIKGKFEKVAEK